MPFTPFKKGSNSHSPSAHTKGDPKPTPSPAGPGGMFDSLDDPGQDEDMNGVAGKPVKHGIKAHGAKPGKDALKGLKAAGNKFNFSKGDK